MELGKERIAKGKSLFSFTKIFCVITELHLFVLSCLFEPGSLLTMSV